MPTGQMNTKSPLLNYATRLEHTASLKGGGPNIGYPGPNEGNLGGTVATCDNLAEAQAADDEGGTPAFTDFPANR